MWRKDGEGGRHDVTCGGEGPGRGGNGSGDAQWPARAVRPDRGNWGCRQVDPGPQCPGLI
jgi:hypothetical protein